MQSILHHNLKQDFVKSAKLSHQLIFITEQNYYSITSNYNQMVFNTQVNIIYDILHNPNYTLYSMQNMPLILQSQTKKSTIQSFKPCSEIFNTPIQLCQSQNSISNAIGVGKGFIEYYDLEKSKATKTQMADKFQNCSSCDTHGNLLAVGNFENHVKLFDYYSQDEIAEIKGHVDAVTQVKFLDNYLFTSARKDNLIYQWDLRYPKRYVHFLETYNNTNQRIQFDIHNNKLIIGDEKGKVRIWNLSNLEKTEIQLANRTINNCLFLNDTQILITVGNRQYEIEEKDLKDNYIEVYECNFE